MTFSRVLYNGNENVVSPSGDLKSIIELDSGNFAYYIYEEGNPSSYYLYLAPNADFINIEGQLIDNSNAKNVEYFGYYTANPYRGISIYAGSEINEFTTILESKLAGYYYTTNFYHAGEGEDVLFFPSNITPYSLSVNPLGIYQLQTGGSGLNYDNYFFTGYEQFETLDVHYNLQPSMLGLSTFTYGKSSLTDRNYGPGSQKQIINNYDNIYFAGTGGTGGTTTRFPENETIDFMSGTDILIYPRPVGSSSLVFSDNVWFLLSNGWSEQFKNLEFLVFTDIVYQLNDDGEINSYSWFDISEPIDFLTLDRNSNPADLTLSTTMILEGIATGSPVATVSSTDEDPGDTHIYSLISGSGDTDNSAFTIDGNQLKIKVSPDYETQDSYSVRIQTKDSGGLSFEKSFTLNVNDLNESPINLLTSASSFNENIVANSVVASLSTADSDSGDTHTYSLVSGTGDTDNSAFTIDGNQLKINTSPDYESQSTYSIRLQTKDSAGLTFEKSFTFNVNDLNEVPTPKPTPTPIPEPTPTPTPEPTPIPEPTPAPVLPPTDLSVSASTFAENIVANSIVATLSSVDPNSGDTHTYSLISGSGDTDNSAFTIDGNQLKIKVSPDYETQDSYSVRIQTTDSGGLTYEENFNLLVTDIDEVDPVTESRVFRLYNPSTGKHLFSSNDFEIDLLTGDYDWVNEGISYVSPSEGNQNLYRFFVESDGRHFYTANDFEKESIINNLPGFQYEGVAFKVFSPIDPPSGSVPVVRYLNVNGGNHVYSSSIEEQGILDESPVWKNEGIAWFGV